MERLDLTLEQVQRRLKTGTLHGPQDPALAAIGDAIAVRTGEKQRIGEIDVAQVLQGLFDLSAQLFA